MRAIAGLFIALALSLPRVAAAQTPSVTPTPAPVQFTFRFDCGAVPWSCGDGPTDIRWQVWRGTRCEVNQSDCVWTRERIVVPDEPVFIEGGQVRLFLGPVSSRATLVNRCSTGTGGGPGKVRLTIFSWCDVNEAACTGPNNWQFYGTTGTGLAHKHKHIGDCSGYGFGYFGDGENIVVHWGLPGELASAPTASATMPPSPTATPVPPTVTEAPRPTDTPSATLAPPTVTSTPTAGQPSPTAAPVRWRVLLPMLGG